MTMPAQRPGRSKQDYGTPWELIRAVEARWGALSIDLAASKENAKASHFISAEMDSLSREWWILRQQFALPTTSLFWLNPPFADIAPWAAKCQLEARRGARVIMLTPASVGSEWFAKHVYGHARVIAIGPRITFEGCADPYPKDCMLTLYGIAEPGFEIWRWKS